MKSPKTGSREAMTFKRRILPSASREARWLCDTYGRDFSRAFDRWCRKIVSDAPSNPQSLMLVPLEEVLDEVKPPWAHIWSELQDRTTLDRLRSLKIFIQTRKPPFELLAAHRRFLSLGSAWINVIAVVNVNRLDEAVEFDQFHWFGDG